MNNQTNKTIWFYTSQKQLERLKKYKYLRRSKGDERLGLKPAVWFSTNQKLELHSYVLFQQGITAFLGDRDSIYFTEDIVRLGIKFDKKRLTSWRNYKLHNVDNELLPYIERAMVFTCSHPRNWYCLFYDVHLSEISHFQKFENGQFVDIK